MTAIASFIFLLLLVSISAEVTLGSFGIFLPFSAIAVLYISGLHGWRAGIAAGIAAGILVDLLYGRPVPLSMIPLAGAAGISFLWQMRGTFAAYHMQVLPGAAAGLLLSSQILLHACPGDILFRISQICFMVIATGLSTPVIIWVADNAGAFFGFERLCGAKTDKSARTEVK